MSEPGGESSRYVRRGLVLKQQRRYSEAENYFRDALSQNPNDAYALMHLAGCQVELPNRGCDALQSIDRALAIKPNEANCHGMRAFILCALGRPAEAMLSIDTAIELDPSSSYAFTARAQAFLVLKNWQMAEEAARQALSLDPADPLAANQLAEALRLQNKLEENAGHMAGMFARDPENASTHCSAGWTALQRGDCRVAEQHFLEALRLKPESEYAREGLLNSFRARSPLYRAYLACSFWMQKVGRKARWVAVLGLVAAVYLARALFSDSMQPVAIGIAFLYSLFVLWLWIAKGVENFILLFDRSATYALRRNEKIEAAFVGGGIGGGLLLLVAGFALNLHHLYMPATALMASSFSLSMTFTNPSKFGPIVFGAIGAAGLLAFVGFIAGYALRENNAINGISRQLWVFAILGAIGTNCLGLYLVLRRGRFMKPSRQESGNAARVQK